MAKKAKQREPTPAPQPTHEPTAWESIKSHPQGVAFFVFVVIVVVALGVVLYKRSHSSHSTQPTVTPYGPLALSASQLSGYAADLNQRFYWVGPRKGVRYEFTRTLNNYVFVRYLPKKVKAGKGQGKYLLIATYPLQGALASLKASKHGKLLKVPGHKGARAAVEPGKRTNVRVAYPGVPFELEVYDPKPSVALEVATSGDLVPVR